MKEIAYIDGTFIDMQEYAVQLEDRGYQMGDGVFETLRLYDGVPFAVKRHLACYRRSMRELKIPITDTDPELYNLFCEMSEKSGIKDGVIYFQLTRGTATRDFKFPVPSLPHLNVILRDTPMPTEAQDQGVRVALVDDIRWQRCDIHSLNLLGSVLAADEAHRLGADEALLLRRDGEKSFITEGLTANFFLVKDGVLWTHPVDNFIWNGVTRMLIKDRLAPALDLTIVQKKFDETFALKADEAFFTSTEGEIVPVIAIGRNAIGDGKPGEVTHRLQEAYHKLIQTGVDMDEDDEK